MLDELVSHEQREWLAQQFDDMLVEHHVLRPSVWAESCRYLPASTTSLPGYYRFSVAPYLREIVDCLSVDSPIREIVIMKGAQIGATVGVLENALGYFIAHVKHAPCMLVTADSELAQMRLSSYIIPMLRESGLDHLIGSSDAANPRKTGRTDKKLEWEGGGFLVPYGAQNANKLRSISIQMLLRDEIDGWPDQVGKDGDPLQLVADRTAAYEQSRKILDISTPLYKGQSKIAKRFTLGDQRYYFVRCLRCSFPQRLRMRTTDESGVVSGLIWETQNGYLVRDSVRYACVQCQHLHSNADKTRLLSPDHGAEWQATAQPRSPDFRSYHLSALYSPVTMQSWETCAQKWLEAWNVEENRPRDTRKLQVFYNNVLGEPFEVRGERVRFEAVSGHRRGWYRFCTPQEINGQPTIDRFDIPNKMAATYCGSHVLFITAAVDVHADNLKCAVFGWCRDSRSLLLDYHTWEGDTEQIDKGPWLELQKLIESREYRGDDDRTYTVGVTFVDSGYRTDQTYAFCAQYAGSVFPTKGLHTAARHQRDKQFIEFETTTGQKAYGITVDHYKERLAARLKLEWNGQDTEPPGQFNAPLDATDKQLKELTAETKVARVDMRTGERIGWEWRRPSGARNELWDLLVYATCAVDVAAWQYCEDELGLEELNWPAFWEALTR